MRHPSSIYHIECKYCGVEALVFADDKHEARKTLREHGWKTSYGEWTCGVAFRYRCRERKPEGRYLEYRAE